MIDKCPICLRIAELSVDNQGDRQKKVKCLLCGEFYVYDDNINIEYIKEKDRYKISGYLRNKFENNIIFKLFSNSIEEILKKLNIPKNPYDIIDDILQHVDSKTKKFSDTINLNSENDYSIFYFESNKELLYFIGLAKELGYLNVINRGGQYLTISLTLQGWERLEDIKKVSTKSNQAFVAMWFDDKLKIIWEKGFKSALEETGYEPIRIDQIEHNNKIDDEIVAEIRKSGLLVADFTGNRGGVYFESGFALGLGIPVIWTCNENDIDNVHFDTNHYNHIVWENEQDLKRKLINRINATLPRSEWHNK